MNSQNTSSACNALVLIKPLMRLKRTIAQRIPKTMTLKGYVMIVRITSGQNLIRTHISVIKRNKSCKRPRIRQKKRKVKTRRIRRKIEKLVENDIEERRYAAIQETRKIDGIYAVLLVVSDAIMDMKSIMKGVEAIELEGNGSFTTGVNTVSELQDSDDTYDVGDSYVDVLTKFCYELHFPAVWMLCVVFLKLSAGDKVCGCYLLHMYHVPGLAVFAFSSLVVLGWIDHGSTSSKQNLKTDVIAFDPILSPFGPYAESLVSFMLVLEWVYTRASRKKNLRRDGGIFGLVRVVPAVNTMMTSAGQPLDVDYICLQKNYQDTWGMETFELATDHTSMNAAQCPFESHLIDHTLRRNAIRLLGTRLLMKICRMGYRTQTRCSPSTF